jgi:thiamine-phosphate pyrophosphorylase
VDWIQLREKHLPASDLATMARECVSAASGSATRILVNDRLDVAIASGAAGVHLGGESLPLRQVVGWLAAQRVQDTSSGSNLPTAFLVGRSCHSVEEVRAAEADGAGYAIFGPVFATPSKLQFGPPLGLELLERACAAVPIPVLAIGGITLDNTSLCLRAGAGGIAAIRLFQQASDVSQIVQALRRSRSSSS